MAAVRKVPSEQPPRYSCIRHNISGMQIHLGLVIVGAKMKARNIILGTVPLTMELVKTVTRSSLWLQNGPISCPVVRRL